MSDRDPFALLTTTPEVRPTSIWENYRLVAIVDDVATTVDIPIGEQLIGRGGQADIRIAASGVSRSHARLHVQKGNVVLVDCGSANGTFVNGVRLAPGASVPLGPGSGFELGTRAVFVLLGAPPDDFAESTPSDDAMTSVRALARRIAPGKM